jgi:hypothetical protein
MSEVPSPVTGTIYDADLPPLCEDVTRHQRSCGLFYLHGVNPSAVAQGPISVVTNRGKYRVTYDAIYVPPGATQWPTPTGDGPPIPPAVLCGSGDDMHVVKQRQSFEVTWEEVAR